MAANNSFFDVLTAAVNDIAEHGYDSAERLKYWQDQLEEAAQRSMKIPAEMERMVNDAMRAIYQKLVDRGDVLRMHPGISRFTLERIKPKLRAELDRRILASADLIKLNREQAIQKTLQRFSGWTTSISAGGSKNVERVETKQAIRKSLAGLPFTERRVIIDQSQKLRASITEIIARDSGAIAFVWHSHWRQQNYNYRPDHKERDEHIYMLRNNWAKEKGLAKVGPDGYYEDITAAAQEPYCRCFVTAIYSLGKLSDDMLTNKGREVLESARAEIERIKAA